MCGIAGVFGTKSAVQDTASLLRAMRHRGPDGSGVRTVGDGAIGMTRLRVRGSESIPLPIDVDGGCAAFNGEIYSTGCGVPTGGDDEARLLLDAIARGMAVDGMFAVAMASSRGVTLLRDGFGIKPLYWRRAGEGFAFASELPPLARGVFGKATIRTGAVAEILAFGRTLGTSTVYKEVHAVSPGSVVPPQASLEPEPLPALRHAMQRAVRACVDSKRPLGLAVSGGLDSSILATELSALGLEDVTTVSILVEGTNDGVPSLDALPFLDSCARTWRHVSAAFTAGDLLPYTKRAVCAMGEPTRMTSAPLQLRLAEAAAGAGVVVLLSGEGADELFGGYASYAPWRRGAGISLLDFACPPARRAWLDALVGREVVKGVLRRFREIYGDRSDADELRRAERSLSLEPLLQRTDRCLMRSSIEGRVPFLHGGVAEIAAQLPSDRFMTMTPKELLRQAWSPRLAQFAGREKRAFRTPIAAWIVDDRTGFDSFLEKSFTDLQSVGIDANAVSRVVVAARSGDAEAAHLVYALATVAFWRQDHDEGAL